MNKFRAKYEEYSEHTTQNVDYPKFDVTAKLNYKSAFLKIISRFKNNNNYWQKIRHSCSPLWCIFGSEDMTDDNITSTINSVFLSSLSCLTYLTVTRVTLPQV